jgi:predicted Zn-dependent peptidase
MVSTPPAKKFVLDNGMTVLHQRNPISRAFCMGVWTRSGARDERVNEQGLCHFLEHMLFKGTPTRSAYDLSIEIERVGGSLDAFTTKDTMCVNAQVLESRGALAFDLVGDMLTNSTLEADALDLERSVILEEIGDVEDAPDDLIHELFAQAVFPDHPLGRPILGTKESVSTFQRSDLRRFKRRVFRGSNLVMSVYGNIPPRELRKICEEKFSFAAGDIRRGNAVVRNGKPKRQAFRRKLHQQHLCIGNRTFSYHEDQRYALMVLTTLLGGGMSSRLFQRIRERNGMSYSIYTYADHSRDAGMVGTYMAVKPSNVRRAVDEVLGEFDLVRQGDVTQNELADVKEHLKGRILLGLEGSTARMMRLARNEISHGRQIGERELLRQIDAVDLDDLMQVADNVLDRDRQSIVSLGPSVSLQSQV